MTYNLFHQTPPEIAKECFNLVPYQAGDSFYEPFRGTGAFYDLFPDPKDWSEICDGRDFLDYKLYPHHIVSNPPWDAAGRDAIIKLDLHMIFTRSFQLAKKSVNFLFSGRALNSLTPKRLCKYQEEGWAVTNLHILNVKKWYGRYYFLQFRKEKPIITWQNNI